MTINTIFTELYDRITGNRKQFCHPFQITHFPNRLLPLKSIDELAPYKCDMLQALYKVKEHFSSFREVHKASSVGLSAFCSPQQNSDAKTALSADTRMWHKVKKNLYRTRN